MLGTNKKFIQKIFCFAIIFGLLVLPVLGFPIASADAAPALGASYVSTAQAFSAALSSPDVGVIHITANIDASAIAWNATQKGDKAITGSGFSLALPQTLSSGGRLEFRDISLVRSNINGTYIFANSYPFKLGTGIIMSEPFIVAIFGGSDSLGSASGTDIIIESGVIGRIYAGANNAVISGDAKVTVDSGASVTSIHAFYSGANITGTKTLTLKNFGSAQGYTADLPPATGFDDVFLDSCYIKMDTWPSWLDAGRLSVSQNSGLWLNGSVSPASRLHGNNSSLIITGDSAVTLPSFADAVTGRFLTSLGNGSGGMNAAFIINGAPFADCFDVDAAQYHKTVSGGDLGIYHISLDRIELVPPAKTLYYLGEPLDTAGGIVNGIYAPAELNLVRENLLTAAMVSGYNTSRLGEQDLTVTYSGKTASYSVWVSDPDITALSLYSLPKTRYNVGNSLDIRGGYIEVKYKNGQKSMVPFTDPSVTVTDFDSSKAGNVLLSVYLNGRPAGRYWATIGGSSLYYGIDNDDETIDLWGLPDNDMLKVGEDFTVTPSHSSGRWIWDDEYFDADIGRDKTATFTALKPGLTRIIFADGDIRAEAVIRITGGAAAEPDDIIEPFENSIPLSIAPSSTNAAIVPPVGAVSSNSPSEPSSSSVPSSVLEPVSQPQDHAEEVAVNVPAPDSQQAARTQAQPTSSINSNNILVVIAGIAAALLIAIVAGVCIWRVTRKSEAY